MEPEGSLPCSQERTIVLTLSQMNQIYILIKGKGGPLHAMKAPGGRGGIAPTHSQPRH
jgi:hypothetical protein